MPGANTQTVDGMLKQNYESFIAQMVNYKNPLKEIVKFKSIPYGGRETVYDAHVGTNISPMFVGEDGAMADAGAQEYVEVRARQRKLMGRIRLTPESMLDTSKGEYAWVEARKSEMDGLIKDMARREEFALATQGLGVLARINEADPTTNTTLILDSPGGITGSSFGNRFIQRGMFVAFVNPNTGALRSGIRKVLAVSSDGTSVTLDAAPASGVADNDYVVQAANSSVTDVLDTSYENAFWGLLALVDDGTFRTNYFGVDRDIYDAYKSYVKASTGPFSVDIAQQCVDVVDQKLGGKTDKLLMQHAQRRVYLSTMQADRRYAGSSLQSPDAGTKAMRQEDLTLGEIGIKVIRDLPYDMIIGLDTEQSGFVCYESEPGKWVDEDGRILIRVGSGSTARDAFEGWYRMRKQYHMRNPGVNWRMDGLTGQTVVVVRPAGY